MSRLLEQLGLPKVPHVIYENPPLILTICQVRFGSVLGVADARYVAPFQKAIEKRYPIARGAEEVVNYNINVTPGGPDIRKTLSQHWRFTDQKDDWTVLLTQDFVSLETRKYDHFGQFLERLKEVLVALAEYIRPTFGTRIGLRYVNEIRLDPTDCSTILRQEMLGPLAVPSILDNTTQAVQQLRLQLLDDQGVNIHHGLFPGGTTVQARSGRTSDSGPFYLLDFDVFGEFEPPDMLPMEPSAICGHVEEFKEVIYTLFRWSVTDEYTSRLGERYNERD